MVICLERRADLHTAQLMPLPLTVSCFNKIQIGFTFLVPAHLVVLAKEPLNGCVCVHATVSSNSTHCHRHHHYVSADRWECMLHGREQLNVVSAAVWDRLFAHLTFLVSHRAASVELLTDVFAPVLISYDAQLYNPHSVSQVQILTVYVTWYTFLLYANYVQTMWYNARSYFNVRSKADIS